MKNIQLNLASRPMRNRRFFFLAIFLLTVLFLFFGSVGTYIFVKFRVERGRTSRETVQLERELRTLQRSENQAKQRLDTLTQANQELVDRVNQIIFRKHFSWVEILSTFERILPDVCYIVSLAPNNQQGRRLGFHLKVASPDIQGLLELITQLDQSGFRDISLIQESPAKSGHVIYDLTFEND